MTSIWRQPILFLGMFGTKDVEQVAHTLMLKEGRPGQVLVGAVLERPPLASSWTTKWSQ